MSTGAHQNKHIKTSTASKHSKQASNTQRSNTNVKGHYYMKEGTAKMCMNENVDSPSPGDMIFNGKY